VDSSGYATFRAFRVATGLPGAYMLTASLSQGGAGADADAGAGAGAEVVVACTAASSAASLDV